VARLQHPSRWTGRIIPLPRGERLDLRERVVEQFGERQFAWFQRRAQGLPLAPIGNGSR